MSENKEKMIACQRETEKNTRKEEEKKCQKLLVEDRNGLIGEERLKKKKKEQIEYSMNIHAKCAEEHY